MSLVFFLIEIKRGIKIMPDKYKDTKVEDSSLSDNIQLELYKKPDG